jgi:hypothetical protein
MEAVDIKATKVVDKYEAIADMEVAEAAEATDMEIDWGKNSNT